MSGFTLRGLGMVMEPEPGNPQVARVKFNRSDDPASVPRLGP